MPRSTACIVAVLLLGACSKLDTPLRPTAQVSSTGTLTSVASASRSWRSRCEGTSIFIDPTTLRITGICNIADFGRVRLAATESAVPGPEGYILNTVTTYTAANGDVLRTTSAGLATLKPDFSGVTFTGIETAVGGTGAFLNATGKATRIGSTRFSDNAGSYTNLGELSIEGRYCACLPPPR